MFPARIPRSAAGNALHGLPPDRPTSRLALPSASCRLERIMLRCLLIWPWLFACCSVMLAADWPEFRGPTGQGLVTDGKLPLEWSGTKNVVWKKGLPGHGWSSPVVAGGRIYLTTAVPVEGTKNDQSLRALCLDPKSGNIEWNE